MLDSELQFGNRPQQELKQMFVTHRLWKKQIPGTPKEVTLGGQGRTQIVKT